jgi:ubiquinone/menaquinone biosynthesis C-methylase UbiE
VATALPGTSGRARIATAAALAVAGTALWWRRHPSACPYGQRFWVEAPHPFITRPRLREALGPVAGQRLLEVGPGTGYYAVEVADWLGTDGRLDVLDVQQEMLDHTLRAAGKRGLAGRITATRGDARALPYADDAFDAAYIVSALGEVPDQRQALRELARVTRPGGRIVVGELFGDPHMVTPRSLREHAIATGLELDRRIGPWVGSFTVLRHPGE